MIEVTRMDQNLIKKEEEDLGLYGERKRLNEYKKYLEIIFNNFINKTEEKDFETTDVENLEEALEKLLSIQTSLQAILKDTNKIKNNIIIGNIIIDKPIIDDTIKNKIEILLAFLSVKIKTIEEIIEYTKNKKKLEEK